MQVAYRTANSKYKTASRDIAQQKRAAQQSQRRSLAQENDGSWPADSLGSPSSKAIQAVTGSSDGPLEVTARQSARRECLRTDTSFMGRLDRARVPYTVHIPEKQGANALPLTWPPSKCSCGLLFLVPKAVQAEYWSCLFKCMCNLRYHYDISPCQYSDPAG